MITIGITTYNRIEHLKKTAQSLYACHKLNICNIRIYDDCSSELNESILREIFPTATQITIRKKNVKSDENIRLMYLDFLQSEDKFLLNADSDLIFNPNWVEFVLDHINKTDGVLSIYNSNYHQSNEFININNNSFISAPHLGSAGTVFTREIVNKIVNEMKYESSLRFDWKWSKYLIENNIRLLVSKTSFIQHIGIDGQNCNGLDQINFGLNFIPGNEININILIEFYDSFMKKALLSNKNAMASIKETKDYKLGHYLLKIPRIILHFFKKK